MDLRIGHMAEPDGRTADPALAEGTARAGSPSQAERQKIADRIARTVLRSEYLPAFTGTGIIAGTISYIGWLFWTVAPRGQLVVWLLCMGGILAALYAGLLIEPLTRARARDLTRFWRRFAEVGMITCTLGIAASVWILLPVADPLLKLYMVFLYVWYLILQLLAAHGDNRVFTPAVVLVIGSLTVFWLTQDVPMRAMMTGFLVLFGATTLLMRRAMRQTMYAAMHARYQAEDARLDLQHALSDVSAERDAKTRFIAAASHDLQQPVQAARLYFDQLLTSNPATRPRILAGGREAFRAVQTLLEDMLEHLRLEDGAVTARPESVALDPLYQEMALQYAAAAAVAGMQIVTRSTPSVVRADRRLLRRALGNLIDNAIKHSGGRRIEVSTAPGLEGAVEIRVADDGCGVSAENAARLFDRDFGIRHTAGVSAPGFGLGLPSAHRIADLLGGTLRLAPSTGRGCDFRLALPEANAT